MSVAVDSVNAKGLNDRISIGQVRQTTRGRDGRERKEVWQGIGGGQAGDESWNGALPGPYRRPAAMPLCSVERSSPGPRGRLVQVTRKIHQTLIFRVRTRVLVCSPPGTSVYNYP